MPTPDTRRPSPAGGRRTLTSAAVAGAAVLLAGCGGAGATAAGTSAAGAVTVTNCGAEVTFDAVPQRVVLLKSASVPYLAALGVLDHVVARAGAYPQEYYDDATWAAIGAIPSLTDELDAGGHVQVSREAVLAQAPDLVLGETDTMDRDTLAASDVPLLEEPVLCATGADEDPGFDDVYSQLRMYGEVFGEQDAAEAAVAGLQERLASVEASVPDGGALTAAVLYPTVGGGTIYAYGNRSMASPQLEAAGLTDVFADVDERVFEVTREELVARAPDVLVLLYSEGDPEEVTAAVTGLSGAATIPAVAQGRIVTQLFNFTEPPSPLAVDGLENIVEQVYGG